MEFDVQRCKGKSGFIVQPRKRLKLDLMALKLPFEVLAQTPGLTVLQVEGVQVNHYPTGKMLIRIEEPLPIAEKVMQCLA